MLETRVWQSFVTNDWIKRAILADMGLVWHSDLVWGIDLGSGETIDKNLTLARYVEEKLHKAGAAEIKFKLWVTDYGNRSYDNFKNRINATLAVTPYDYGPMSYYIDIL